MNTMLTSKQQAVLAYVQAHHRQHGHHPSLREIQAHFGFASPFAATRHLQALKRKGVLERVAGKARAFIEPGRKLHRSVIEIPLYGVIPAGSPTAAEQQPDSYITIDPAPFSSRITGSNRLFALRVRGDSMTGASILDGDIVFLTPREPRPREIVAALIDGESTLKRFLVQRGRPFLRAENPAYPDLLPVAELVIQGVMVGLLRTQS
jgi:repressor LexA